MTIDEAEWHHAHQALRRSIGARAAATVMAALPRHEPATSADLEALERRLDSRFEAVDARFDALRSDLRSEMHTGFADVRVEIATSQAELASRVEGVLRQHLMRVAAMNGAVVLGAVGLAVGIG